MRAINAFVCSVISYSKVKRVVFESRFRNPPKKYKDWGKNFPENFVSSKDGPVKSTETRQGMLWNGGSLLFGLQRNVHVLASLVNFVV